MRESLLNDAFTGKDMVADVAFMLATVSDKTDDELKHVAGMIVLYVANQIKAKLVQAAKLKEES